MPVTKSTIERLKAEAQQEAKAIVAQQKKSAERDFPNVPDDTPTVPSNVHKMPVTDAMRPTMTGRGKRTFVMPEVTPKAKKEQRASKARRMTEADILAKYSHAKKGTLQFDATLNKQTIEAKLQCGHAARVATSDLFQVKRCEVCRKAVAKKRVQELKKADPKKVGINGKAKKTSKK